MMQEEFALLIIMVALSPQTREVRKASKTASCELLRRQESISIRVHLRQHFHDDTLCLGLVGGLVWGLLLRIQMVDTVYGFNLGGVQLAVVVEVV